MSQEDEVTEDARPAVDQTDQLKSYAGFALRALKKRIFTAIAIFVALALATVVTYSLWPRSFHCQSTLMVQGNVVLDSAEVNPFSGATSVILRHENLLAMVKETGLAKRVLADRPPLLRLKDRLTGLSNVSERDLELMAVGTLERAISVSTWENTLTIAVDWNNPEMAARLVKLAQKSFLEARHVAEISTISEKMAILDAHSAELRKEIDAIAAQLRDLRDEKIADMTADASANAQAAAAATPKPAARPAARASSKVSEEELRRRKEELDELKTDLEKKKRSYEAMKADRSGRLLAAQEQRTALLGTYTPAHPEVKKVDRLIQSLTGESAPMITLRQEIASLTEQVKAKTSIAEALARAPSGGGGSAAPAPTSDPNATVLPLEVLKLLESGQQIDPAATVQLEGAVSKYASLRDAVRSARVDLDTAQAAFNHRYKVVAPAEVPGRPSKPDKRKVFGVGLLLALAVALLVPIAAELRSDVIVARWQVQHMQLPILAELQLPPSDRG